jgi:hypothetical protein
MSMDQIKQELQDEKDKLLAYMQKSYKARTKWVKQNKIDCVIQAEMGMCIASNRLDLIENLLKRKEKIEQLMKTIEEMEYIAMIASSQNENL